MRYIKVEFEKAGVAFQEVDDRGNVARYIDERGRELFTEAPPDDGCSVIEDDTQPTPDMVAATAIAVEARDDSYNWEKQGDRRNGRRRGRRSTDLK